MSVRPGIEVLAEEKPGLVRGARVALLAHPASVDRTLRHAAAVLRDAGARIARLFAPEHGGSGRQDMVRVDETLDPLVELPVVSLYGESEDSLTPRPEHFAGVDVLVADLADVGARYYTFAATVIRALAAAARAGVRVVIADRPDPIDGVSLEGGLVQPGYHSFVGELPVPVRHGMTLGELARFAAAERRIDVELEVVPARGWKREQWWDETGLPWVMPSPNMPTLDTAAVYPGGCLVEGTNLSEGRGTTRPFELVGAPWLDARELARALESANVPGARFRPVRFVPAFHKHAGLECQGVQVHVVERRAFPPVVAGLALVIAARAQDPGRFDWRREPYEFVSDRPAFDLLAGGPGWRAAIEAGAAAAEIRESWQAELADFTARREAFLLY